MAGAEEGIEHVDGMKVGKEVGIVDVLRSKPSFSFPSFRRAIRQSTTLLRLRYAAHLVDDFTSLLVRFSSFLLLSNRFEPVQTSGCGSPALA